MRFYSYLYHGLLALFMLAVSSVALVSGTTLRLDMLPWPGQKGTYVLLGAGIFGILVLLLALKGTLRFLFFLWSLAVFVMLFKGYFLSSYQFSGGFQGIALLTLGALVAIFGAWFQMTRSIARRRM
jgi:hypothetical protein